VPCSEVLLKYCTNTVRKYILEDYAVDQFFSFGYVKLMSNEECQGLQRVPCSNCVGQCLN
jgi:hypothetical protein